MDPFKDINVKLVTNSPYFVPNLKQYFFTSSLLSWKPENYDCPDSQHSLIIGEHEVKEENVVNLLAFSLIF